MSRTFATNHTNNASVAKRCRPLPGELEYLLTPHRARADRCHQPIRQIQTNAARRGPQRRGTLGRHRRSPWKAVRPAAPEGGTRTREARDDQYGRRSAAPRARQLGLRGCRRWRPVIREARGALCGTRPAAPRRSSSCAAPRRRRDAKSTRPSSARRSPPPTGSCAWGSTTSSTRSRAGVRRRSGRRSSCAAATRCSARPTPELVQARPQTSRFDYEGEIGVLIGRGGRYIPAADAMAAIAGYVVLNDATAREWQARGEPVDGRARNFDASMPCGPELVTADEIDVSDAPADDAAQRRGDAVRADSADDLRHPAHDRVSVVVHDAST